MAENIVDQNTDLSLSEMELVQVKTNNNCSSQGAVLLNNKGSFMGNFSDSLSLDYRQRNGNRSKDTCSTFSSCSCQAVYKYYDPSQVDRYTSQENFKGLMEVIK
jgi:hypothetical protein